MENQELLTEIHKLKATRAYRLDKEKYRYYTPIGAMEPFIDAIGSGQYLAIATFAANGVGKTACGVNILANLIWPRNSPYFHTPLFKKWPYPKKIRIVANSNTIVETIIPEMKNWFPTGRYGVSRYETTKEGKRYEARWTTDTGWDVHLMTYDQDVSEFESATVGLIWCDEPPPKPIYTANIARLRRGGLLFITATPLMGSAWMYDDFCVSPGKQRIFFSADVEDACIQHGKRGFLDHQTIVNIVSQYDPDEKRARAFGKFQFLSGLIFKKFDIKIHVMEPFTINEREWSVTEAVDPHTRTPDAVTWVATNREGTKIIVDEMWKDGNTEQFVERVKEKRQRYRVEKAIIDPSAFNVDKHTGRSFAGDLASKGLTYQPASKRRADAIKRTKQALDYIYRAGMWIREPELYVFDTCHRHIYEFTHWQWEEWQGKTAQFKSLKEKPVDKDDHVMENVGRILLEEPRFIPMHVPSYNPYGKEKKRNTSGDPY